MLSPRLSLLLMIAGMFVPTLAQGSSENANTEALTRAAPAGASPVITFHELQLSGATPGQSFVNTLPLKKSLQSATPKAMGTKSQCFTMRSYKFKQDNAARGELRPAGESTCEAASTFSLKDAFSTK